MTLNELSIFWWHAVLQHVSGFQWSSPSKLLRIGCPLYNQSSWEQWSKGLRSSWRDAATQARNVALTLRRHCFKDFEVWWHEYHCQCNRIDIKKVCREGPGVITHLFLISSTGQEQSSKGDWLCWWWQVLGLFSPDRNDRIPKNSETLPSYPHALRSEFVKDKNKGIEEGACSMSKTK